MNEQHDELVQTVFDIARQDMADDGFSARVSANIEAWSRTQAVIDALQGGAALCVLALLYMFVDLQAFWILAAGVLIKVVEGPWLLTLMIVIISLCLVPTTSRADRHPS